MTEPNDISEDWKDAQSHELEFWRGRGEAKRGKGDVDPNNSVW